jgi:hypothetical protein
MQHLSLADLADVLPASRPSCLQPQPAIPAGWIWAYWADPLSEFPQGLVAASRSAALHPAASNLADAATLCPAECGWGGGRGGCTGATCTSRSGRARLDTPPTPPPHPPPPPHTHTAGYTLYGLVVSQLGDVTTLTTLPGDAVRFCSDLRPACSSRSWPCLCWRPSPCCYHRLQLPGPCP